MSILPTGFFVVSPKRKWLLLCLLRLLFRNSLYNVQIRRRSLMLILFRRQLILHLPFRMCFTQKRVSSKLYLRGHNILLIKNWERPTMSLWSDDSTIEMKKGKEIVGIGHELLDKIVREGSFITWTVQVVRYFLRENLDNLFDPWRVVSQTTLWEHSGHELLDKIIRYALIFSSTLDPSSSIFALGIAKIWLRLAPR